MRSIYKTGIVFKATPLYQHIYPVEYNFNKKKFLRGLPRLTPLNDVVKMFREFPEISFQDCCSSKRELLFISSYQHIQEFK